MPGFLLQPPWLHLLVVFRNLKGNELDGTKNAKSWHQFISRCISAVKDSWCEWSPQEKKKSGLFWRCNLKKPNPSLWKEAQCHNTIYHHYIPHIVVEDTIPHYSWQSVYSDNALMNWNNLLLKKKTSCQFIIMLDENAVSECGTKPVCISGIYLLCFYWQVLWLKICFCNSLLPSAHTWLWKFRIALKSNDEMEINNGWCNSSFVFMYLKTILVSLYM